PSNLPPLASCPLTASLTLVSLTPLPSAAQEKTAPTGYTDTPFLPGGKWRVHDDARPRPLVVTPGKTASEAPSDAIVLFDGRNLDEWVMEKDNSPADWLVQDGFVEVPPKGHGVGGYMQTKREFG